MYKYLILVISMVSINANADTYLDINGFSKHSQPYYIYKGEYSKFNSQNFGVGITNTINKNLDFKVGMYYNSYYKLTVYSGFNLNTDFIVKDFTVTPGIMVGGATGYNNTPVHSGFIQFVVIPNIAVNYKKVGVTFGYIPAGQVREGEEAVSVVTMQFQYKIK